MSKKLTEYQKKRRFKKTPEPEGSVKKRISKKLIFVIQEHAARAHHYDFRIEIEGVLVSWAVPKGPSMDPRVKRLAVPTEDHPIEYAKFEGVIPKGHYGAGPVIVWDRGSYENLKQASMSECLKKGRIAIFLHGKKLTGGYSLIRTGKKAEKRWLLIKMRDAYADARRRPTHTQVESVISGKTIEEMEKSKRKT